MEMVYNHDSIRVFDSSSDERCLIMRYNWKHKFPLCDYFNFKIFNTLWTANFKR